MRFHHIAGRGLAEKIITRPAAKAGAIRFAHGAPETHMVEFPGDEPAEHAYIELRAEPLDRPTRDVPLPPVSLDPSKSTVMTQFENG